MCLPCIEQKENVALAEFVKLKVGVLVHVDSADCGFFLAWRVILLSLLKVILNFACGKACCLSPKKSCRVGVAHVVHF